MEVSRFESAYISPSPFSLLLSLSLSLSLSSLTSNSMEISRFEFPNFHPCFIFTLSLFSLDRMEVPRFESAYKSPTSLSPFSLPLSLPARLDENSKIRIHPNFQISKFPSPSFSFHSIGRTLVQAWSAYEYLSSSSLLLVLFDPSELIFLLLSPPLLGCAPIRRSRLVPGILPPQPGELSQNYGPPVPRKPGPHRDLGEAPSY